MASPADHGTGQLQAFRELVPIGGVDVDGGGHHEVRIPFPRIMTSVLHDQDGVGDCGDLPYHRERPGPILQPVAAPRGG